jgi:potassium efflux system protein
LAKRDKNLAEKEVTAWQRLVTARRTSESEQQAREARREVANATPALRQLAERNAQLAEERTKLSNSIAKASSHLDAITRELEELRKHYEDAEEKVRYAGRSSTVGLMLRKQRERLPDPDECEDLLRYVGQEMPEANLQRIELDGERNALADLDAAVQHEMLGLARPMSAYETAYLAGTVREMLEKKRDLLDGLTNDYDTYLSELSELEVETRKLITKSQELADCIEEHVLWIRSCEPVRLGVVGEAAGGVLSILRPRPWLETGYRFALDSLEKPLFPFSALLAVAGLIALKKRLSIRMAGLCAATSGSVVLRFRPTVKALLLAAVIASPWPLLLALIGLRMTTGQDMPDLGRSVGLGLQYVAVLLFVSKLTRRICKSGGVAESHFGWPARSLQIVRRSLGYLTWTGLPLAMFVVVASQFEDGQFNDSLGRLAFILAMLVLAGFMHALFRSKTNVLLEVIAKNPDGWLARIRFVLHLAAIGLPCGLSVLAAAGYYYSAQQLALRLEITLALVLGLVLFQGMASRWFLVKRRNMSIEQARQRQAQQSEGGPSGVIPVDRNQDQRDLSAIHEQLRYLLRHAMAVCVFVGAWLIWADVTPALKVLDNKVLWWNKMEIHETHEDADGNLVHQTVEKDVPTTWRHALFASLLLCATFFIGRNLPALLEITVLERLPFDTGGRHAISVILRYLVGLTGFVMACRTMSITWSSIQWLAAGMTVGLGFGLQEIFANFVSGLILLFERPIRVGDVITLDDITGKVTNIRIRATTVTNWDRKELIVPNKELITGRLLNWTLSDTTNRIVITVGIAYKSDTRRARELILEIASGHPNVLDDPAPRVTFEAFADSSLNFVLRCYIASMDIRLDTIDELHETIHDRFNQEGIEIAFPQQDLHLRSIDTGLNQLGSAASLTEQPLSRPAAADGSGGQPPRRVA